MNFSDFNFATPAWLWGLMLIPIGWGWYQYWSRISKTNMSSLNKFIDQKLLPHLLIKSASNSKKTNYGWVYALLTFFIIIALANPRWNYDDIDAYQTTASMVILFDLSASMNATDVAPSRIIRARQNVEDLINLSKGLKIGLIGFAGNAHLISPITDDLQTVRTYIPALDTDLTKLQGNSLHTALRTGAELLYNEPGDRKSMLLISDGNFKSSDFSKELSQIHSQNIQVNVMGVGTATGAPYKNHTGALHKIQGKTVVSKLGTKELQTIAKLGHGIYTEAIYNDSGVKTILASAQQIDTDEKIVSGKVRQWQDKYYWFIMPVAALLLYLFRQRVLYVALLVFSLGLFNTPDVMAMEMGHLFRNSEQQAQQQYIKANFKAAAELFTDPYNKGVALYRDGEYAAAEQSFKAAQSSSNGLGSIYNTGNAQMQQQKWRAAIKSYESVLQQDPEHVAAIHNLAIAKLMLEQNKDQDESQDQDENQDNSDEKQQEQEPGKQQENKQQDSKSSEKEDSQQSKEQDSQNSPREPEKQQQQSMDDSKDDKDKENESKEVELKNAEIAKVDEQRAQQWLSRIDSDIKVFLKNKFYIEDLISAQ